MTESSQETKETRCARRIIERLKMFNRKERDHLMKFALCEDPKTPEISLALWKKISNGGRRPHVERMFIGMDYHLNWLYAALATAEMSDEELATEFDNEWKCKAPPKGHKDSSPIQKNQEDIDLLVAWIDRYSNRLQLALIEAKLDSGWTSEQWTSKKERLTLISDDARIRKLNFIDFKVYLFSRSEPCKGAFKDKEFGRHSEWKIKWCPFKADNLKRVKRVSDTSDKWEIV